LAIWLTFIGAFILVAYAARLQEGKPDTDTLYEYSFAIAGAVQYGLILLVVGAIAGFDRNLLALRRPRSWPRALGLAAAVAVGLLVVINILEHFLHAGEEQGLVPKEWEPSRAGAFAASFVVVAVVAPFVEELTYRGLGFSLLEPFGDALAIVVVGVLFALSHGLVEGLVELSLFGCALAWLRMKTDSVVPGMFVHGAFNAIALISVLLVA